VDENPLSVTTQTKVIVFTEKIRNLDDIVNWESQRVNNSYTKQRRKPL